MILEDNELLVIGASGHTARYFFERLDKENYQKTIKCLIRNNSQVDHLKCYDLNLEFIHIDFDEIDSLKTSMKGAKILLNIAGIKVSEKIVQVGIEAGINWFICVHTTGIFSRFKSASELYKKIEDNLLKNYSNLTILRPTMIYGSSKDKNMFKLIHYIHSSKFFPVFGNGKNLMSPVYAKDLGNAYYDVIQNRNATFGNQYNLSGKSNLSYISILEETSSALKKKIFFIHIPIWFCLVSAHLMSLVLRSHSPVSVEQVLRMKENKVFSWEDAYADFGFSPISFQDGISLEVKKYKESLPNRKKMRESIIYILFPKISKLLRFFKIYGIGKTLFKAAGRSRGKIKILGLLLKKRKRNPDIGVIGCGQFTHSTLGYAITKKYGNRFLDCYDSDFKAAESFADFYNINNHSQDSRYIFDNDRIKYVFIASNHASHTDYAIEALSKNKTVYIEKPIAVNMEQLSKLLLCVKRSSKPIFAGYNRPFSKAIIELKKHTPTNVALPITLNCFVSAHKLKATHWYRDPKEGTRICGNVGHWIDLAIHILSWNQLPDQWDIQIAYSDSIENDDNLSITLTSSKGDLIVIVMTSRTEPFEGINETINFQHGHTICKIDDFRSCTIWKKANLIKKSYWPKDIGDTQALYQPFEEKPFREWGEVVKSTILTIHIAEMVKQNNSFSSFSFNESIQNL